MSHKRFILVTGGNKGIGRAVCERLVVEWPDTVVIVGSRDRDRGEQAVKDMVRSTRCDPSRLSCLQIDTSSDESVREAAKQLSIQLDQQKNEMAQQQPVRLYGVVNNAGIGWGYTVADTINTNYFGPRRVNDAFISLLRRPGGRIVNVASASGPNFVQELKDEALKEKLYRPRTLKGGIEELDRLAKSPWESDNGYGISKALLNAYTVLHAKANPDLVINSVTPGWIQTDLTKGTGATNPPAKGAIPVCTLLMDEAFADPALHPTGRYYGSDAVRSPMHYYRGPGEDPYVNDDDLV